MRRGGRLFILLGIVIAAVAALLGYVVLQGQNQTATLPNVVPTAVPQTKKVVSALIDIPSNTVLTETETFLTFSDISEEEYNANPGQFFVNPSDLQNKLTLRTISVNEVIHKDDVIDAGLSLKIPTAAPNEPRPKAYPFQVNNLTGVADQIKPGDFVDVVVSLEVTRFIVRQGFDEATGQPRPREQEVTSRTTKTLVQNVQVLQIQRPQVAPEGTPTPEGQASGPPQTDASGQPVNGDQNQGQPGQGSTVNQANTLTAGNWVLLLAVTDQEAEIIKYSLEQGSGVTLVLRGRGDTAVETTSGVTLDILVSQFGLPVPLPPPTPTTP